MNVVICISAPHVSSSMLLVPGEQWSESWHIKLGPNPLLRGTDWMWNPGIRLS